MEKEIYGEEVYDTNKKPLSARSSKELRNRARCDCTDAGERFNLITYKLASGRLLNRYKCSVCGKRSDRLLRSLNNDISGLNYIINAIVTNYIDAHELTEEAFAAYDLYLLDAISVLKYTHTIHGTITVETQRVLRELNTYKTIYGKGIDYYLDLAREMTLLMKEAL